MTRINFNNSLFLGLVASIGLVFSSGHAAAQSSVDPTAEGGGKKAYVVLIVDSSASMEYTTEADNVFPTTNDRFPFAVVNEAAPIGNPAFPDWKPGDSILAGTNYAFGSCFVYHPTTVDCAGYRRPSWRPEPDASWPIAMPPSSWGPASSLFDPLAAMRGDYTPAIADCSNYGICVSNAWRLQDPTQPRHVTLKEILAGSMIMLPDNAASYSFNPSFYDADTTGPGCWFVPRQRDASTQPLVDQEYCEVAGSDFEALIDFDQPLPHFQEVYDLQQPNGVLDTLATTALFAVAAFDGFREDANWGGFPATDPLNNLNDNMVNSAPDDMSYRVGSSNEDDADCDGDGQPDDPCYNLGVWQIVGPSSLNVPSALLPQLSAYAQVAVNDTGYLTTDTGAEHTLYAESGPSRTNSFLGPTFSPEFENYVRGEVPLGKQPIARATPIAAAIMDVYQFFAYGQEVDGVVEDPINTDTFDECRPKHVVMLTDGQPSPERDPANDPSGVSDTLNEAFGYEPTRYKYATAEEEIALLTDDFGNLLPDAGSSAADRNRYLPRVHILGLNLEQQDDAAIEKMARMAVAGNSCASALVPQLVPQGYTYEDLNGNTHNGTCDPGTGCLVYQRDYAYAYKGGSEYEWYHPSDDGQPINCTNFPALVLDNNDPELLGSALSSFLSSLVQTSGLTTRTRLAVTNRLDDISIPAGGQYRVYSGVKIGNGSAWWKGVLNRNTIFCDNTLDNEVVSLDSEIGELVVDTTFSVFPLDRRRVWTSLPSSSIWDYPSGGVPKPVVAADPDFPMQYSLAEVPDADEEFEDTYLTTDATGRDLVIGTRVPFERNTINTAMPIAPYDHFNVFGATEFREMVHVFRARIKERTSETRGGYLPDEGGEPQDRVLGGILNSNPIIVGPPGLDLPIASYREFRARYADRTSMLYVSSVDGLLHAIHVGALEERVRRRSVNLPDGPRGGDALGNADEQREAWAYMPWMLHRELSSYTSRQGYLMDGTPVAKDVRLCNEDPTENTNVQACQAACTGGCTTMRGSDQWRSVLVQGRGLAGAGYYAMDVTRPGGLQLDDGNRAIENPDPILLWELDREWEKAQVEYFWNAGERLRIAGPSGLTDEDLENFHWDRDECSTDEDELWQSPMMGLSISEPEIATVIVNGKQRPVAVFGGGARDVNQTGCGSTASGMAIYVVDLQTGSLLRRFTHYTDDGAGLDRSFLYGEGTQFVGSPALYDASVGAIATRGFIGDNAGRLFKIDFLSQNPLDWKVSLFYEVDTGSADVNTLWTNAGHSGSPQLGPAAFKPAVTVTPDRTLMVVYGLGEAGEVVTNEQGQAVIAVTEKRGDPTQLGTGAWLEFFEPEEKMTGEPVIFNGDVYFPTYSLPDDKCEAGYARIWGLNLTDTDDTTLGDADGIFDQNPNFTPTPPLGIETDGPGDIKWFGPEEPTLIRGLTITLGPLCAIDDVGTNNPTFSADEQAEPQLIAQTSSNVSTDITNTDSSLGYNPVDEVNRLIAPTEPPKSQTIPLSWSILY